jgi:hypothetical protein
MLSPRPAQSLSNRLPSAFISVGLAVNAPLSDITRKSDFRLRDISRQTAAEEDCHASKIALLLACSNPDGRNL